MQVEIRIDAACREPKIIVVTDRMTDELSAGNHLIAHLKEQ